MRLARTIALLLFVCAGIAGAAPPPSPAVTAIPGATTRWSTKHLFAVGYVPTPSPVPLLQVHSWTLTIVDAAGRPVNDATITVDGGMPAHAHGLPTTPQVKALGEGRYLVEGLKFHMPGDWVVGFRIKAGAVVDAVKFDLQLD
jgi:YtkA-like protein